MGEKENHYTTKFSRGSIESNQLKKTSFIVYGNKPVYNIDLMFENDTKRYWGNQEEIDEICKLNISFNTIKALWYSPGACSPFKNYDKVGTSCVDGYEVHILHT